MSARKVGLLILIVAFAASLETAWQLRGDVRIGPEGCRVMSGRFYGPSWSFEAADERALAGTGTPRLEVTNAYGEVSVKAGGPGRAKVKLRKVVFLPTEEKARAFAERIELRLAGGGELVRVGTNRDELGRAEDTGFETHLEIEVPPETVVEARNQHGRVTLAGVAAADVGASFEGVAIARVAGDVTLEARHGDVSVERVGGRLELNSRHGSVSVADVAGASRLDVQHGDLELQRTGGVEADLKHGELRADGVGGDLVVRGGHAPVRAKDVTGRAEVETTFGHVRLERVGGELRARAEHGGLTAFDVAGGASVQASHDGIRLERVAGAVEIQVEHGGVEAKALAGGVRVRATGADVSLDGFAGRAEVEVERGSARLAPGGAIEAEIVARARHGEVVLEVPEGSRFDLAAESERGQVRGALAGITSEDAGRRGQKASGRHAGGGASVRLSADGDVTLKPRPARTRDGWAVAAPRAAAKPVAEATPAAASPAPRATPLPSPRPAPAEPTAATPEKPSSDPGA